MKIAVWHNLNSGGGKRALYDHVQGLIERGHTVVSYCPDTVDQTFLPLSQLTEEVILPLKSKVLKRKSKLKLFNTPALIYEKFTAEIEHCMECSKAINENNFDLLFANSSTFSYMAHIGRFIKIPQIIYLGEPNRKLYEAIPEFLWKAPDAEKFYKKNYIIKRAKHLYNMYWFSYLALQEYKSAETYDLILVNSFFSKESVKRAYNLESKVCYLGIDNQKFYPSTNTKEPFVLGLGSISVRKGIEQYIDCLSIIEETVRPTFIWIGNMSVPDYLEKIKLYAAEKKVNIKFLIGISDIEMVNCLSKASVVLYLPHLEPFGLAPLEANCCGTAVIAIKEGGIKETIIHSVNGLIVNEFDPVQIARYIQLFVTNLNYAEEFGRRCREYVVENWSLKTGIDNIEFIMMTLLKEKDRYNNQ